MIAQQFYKKEMIFMPAYKDEKLVNGSPSSIIRTGRESKNRSGKEVSPPKRKP